MALGGGHGLAATLTAARRYAGDLSAIVSVADDGGSSGRLRHDFGVAPPGDVRRCLVALADAGSAWGRAFEHRFEGGELDGHALGNLVITGLAQVLGDFQAAVAEAGRLLGVVGRVYPATSEPVVLTGVVAASEGTGEGRGGPPCPCGTKVEGQVAVGETPGIATVGFVPERPATPPAALEALAGADQVVIGPGSLFTSVLAAVAVPAVREALGRTPARKVYVCNLRTQAPETSGYDVARHVAALAAHGVDVDVVLCDPRRLPVGSPAATVVARELCDHLGNGHDPLRLAAALADLVG